MNSKYKILILIAALCSICGCTDSKDNEDPNPGSNVGLNQYKLTLDGETYAGTLVYDAARDINKGGSGALFYNRPDDDGAVYFWMPNATSTGVTFAFSITNFDVQVTSGSSINFSGFSSNCAGMNCRLFIDYDDGNSVRKRIYISPSEGTYELNADEYVFIYRDTRDLVQSDQTTKSTDFYYIESLKLSISGIDLQGNEFSFVLNYDYPALYE